jgi:di/tricarboxylate transporter
MALPVAYLTPIAVILRVNTILNIVFYKAGYFSQKQIVAYGLVTSLVCTVLILVVGLPYWGMLGLT